MAVPTSGDREDDLTAFAAALVHLRFPRRNHTVALNGARPCDDQALIHHEIGLARAPPEEARPCCDQIGV
jgi:hypothetical protein